MGIDSPRMWRIAIVVLAACLSITTVAKRVVADPPSQSINAKATGRTFDAMPVDLSFLGPVESGRIVLRPRRMTERRALAPLVEFVQTSLDESVAANNGMPTWRPRLESVDFYALQLHRNVDLSDPDAIDQHAGIAVAADLAIRFIDAEAAADFWKWTQRTPRAETIDEKGFSYVRVAAEPTGDREPGNPFGAMYIAKRDARTFVLSENSERLRSMAAKQAAAPVKSHHEAAVDWATLDGGMVTAYGDKQATELGMLCMLTMAPHLAIFGESLETDALGDGMTMLHQDLEAFGCGFDLDPATSEVTVSLKVRCHDAAAAGRVKAAIATLQAFARVQLAGMEAYVSDPSQSKSLSSSERAALEAYLCWARLIDQAKIESRPSEGELVDLKIEASASFPSIEGLTAPAAETE